MALAAPNRLLPHILLVAPNALGSSSFYIAKPLAQLARFNHLTFRLEAESQVDRAEVRASDAVLFCRTIEPQYDWILQECLERSIPTAYHLDDNLWEVPPGYAYTDYYRAPQRLAQLERYLRSVGRVHVYNAGMLQRAREYNPNVRQLLPSIDLRSLPTQPPPRSDERIRLTYVSSRGAVDPLVKLFADDLQRLLDTYPGLFEVTWWGEAPERFRDHPATRVRELIHDYDRFLQELADGGYDIGLAPLLPTAFHLSKTNTKYRDYGACHIAGVYSEVETYTACVKDGYTGLIAANKPGAWFDAMHRLVANPHLRDVIRRAAFEDVDAHYRQELAELEWLDVLRDMLPTPPVYAGVDLPTAYQELRQGVEDVYTRLTEQNNHNRLAEIDLDRKQGELTLQMPLARTLANELEAFRSRKLLRFVERLRDRTDYAPHLGPAFTRLLDDSRLFRLAAPGSRLRPGPNLARTPFASYRLPVPRPGLRRIHLAALFDLYPQRGLLRLELAAANGAVLARSETPAAGVRADQPVTFTLDLPPAPGVYELRLSAVDVSTPLRVYEWQPPRFSRRPPGLLCALDFAAPGASA